MLAGAARRAAARACGRCVGRRRAAAAESPSPGPRRRTRRAARPPSSRWRTARGGPTSRSRSGGCRWGGRGRARLAPVPRWRRARGRPGTGRGRGCGRRASGGLPSSAGSGARGPEAAVRRDVGSRRGEGVDGGRPASPSRSPPPSSSWRRRRRASCAPVEELAELGQPAPPAGGVVEVHLVPVQPAHRRVRAGVERLVEEGGVQRQRRDDVDAVGRAVRPPASARWPVRRQRRVASPTARTSGRTARRRRPATRHAASSAGATTRVRLGRRSPRRRGGGCRSGRSGGSAT